MSKVNDSLREQKITAPLPSKHRASLWPLFDVSFKQRDRNPPQKQNKGTQHFPHKPGVERTLKTSKSEQMWLAQRWHPCRLSLKKATRVWCWGCVKRKERMCGAETVASLWMGFTCRRQCHSCHLLVLRGMEETQARAFITSQRG